MYRRVHTDIFVFLTSIFREISEILTIYRFLKTFLNFFEKRLAISEWMWYYNKAVR